MSTPTTPLPLGDSLEENLLELVLTGDTPRTAKDTRKRIFVMSPGHHSSHTDGYKECYKALIEANLPYEFITGSISGCGVAKARNMLMAAAINLDCNAVLCWDSDIAPGKDAQDCVHLIERLLSHPESLGNVAGLYAAKAENQSRWIMTPLLGERRTENGLLKVLEAGTGLKLIWMWQIHAIINAHPEIAYTPDDSNARQTAWDFFSMGVVNGRYLSEDYYFDYRLRQLGFDVWVDTQITTRHRGRTADGRVIDFPISPIPAPGLPPQDAPKAGKWPKYLAHDAAWYAGVSGKTDLQGWNSTAPIFKDLIGKINPEVIIEVGSWKGASAIHMASLSDATIYCCDTWLGGIDHALGDREHDQLPRQEPGRLFSQFCTNVVKAGLTERIIPITQPSINAARWLHAKGVTSALIYIDASHEYVDVCQDLTAYWKLLLPGGVIFGDDFSDPNNPGVAQAVKWFATRERIQVQVTDTGHWSMVKPCQS